MHGKLRRVGQGADTPLAFCCIQQGRVVSSAHGRCKRALEFLKILGLVHAPARRCQLLLRQVAGFRSRKTEARPDAFFISACLLPYVIEQVVRTLRRAAEKRASLTVGQHGAQHLRPYLAGHVCRFVQHQIIQIQAAQGLRVFRSQQTDAAPGGQHADKLAFQKSRAGHGPGKLFAVVPGYRLGLPQEGRGIGCPPVVPAHAQCLTHQIIDRRHRFAEAPVAEQHAEASALLVKAPLQRARAVWDDVGCRLGHGKYPCFSGENISCLSRSAAKFSAWTVCRMHMTPWMMSGAMLRIDLRAACRMPRLGGRPTQPPFWGGIGRGFIAQGAQDCVQFLYFFDNIDTFLRNISCAEGAGEPVEPLLQAVEQGGVAASTFAFCRGHQLQPPAVSAPVRHAKAAPP